jgi:hypothetical protein
MIEQAGPPHKRAAQHDEPCDATSMRTRLGWTTANAADARGVAWTGTSEILRKLRRYVGLPKLIAALRPHDRPADSTSVDASNEAA